MVPGAGELFDLANAGIYALEGNYIDAGMSAAAAIPGIGSLVTTAKLSTKLAAITGTYGTLKRAKLKDGHHIIQDAAVRDLPNYSRSSAPAIQLEGPSTKIGSSHYRATQTQRQKGGGNYAAERRIGYKALRKAGISRGDATLLIRRADQYFHSLGVSSTTITRIPGNRR